MFKHRLFTLVIVAFSAANVYAQTSIGTLEDLRTALQDATVMEVKLTGDISGVTDELYLQITRENFVFDGDGHTITGCVTGFDKNLKASSHSNTLDVIADGVTVKNVTLINTGTGTNGKAARNAMTVWHCSNVVLENVRLINSGGGGLQVVGATVSVKGIETSGNTWYGVGISESVGTKAVASKLTLDDNSVFGEAYQVTAESADQIAYPAGSTWGTVTVPGSGVVATDRAERDGDLLLAKINTLDELSVFQASVTSTSFDGVLLAAGTYSPTATLTLSKNMVVKGSGVDQTVIRSSSSFNPLVSLKAGTLSNLSLIGYDTNNDGANQNQSGIQVINGTVAIENVKVQNFRSGISVDTNSGDLTLKITNSLIDNNRTGIILTCKGSLLNATITGNTITNNRTLGILLNYTSANWAGATLNITRNSIHDNWFGEFETRVTKIFDISGNYWGTKGPVFYNTFADETPHPLDGGSAINNKPLHYSDGEIYQPTHATYVNDPANMSDFTAGVLLLNTYYTDEALTNLVEYSHVKTTDIEADENLGEAITNLIDNVVTGDTLHLEIKPDATSGTVTLEVPAAIIIDMPVVISSENSNQIIHIVAPGNGEPAFTVSGGGSLTLNNIELDSSNAPSGDTPLVDVQQGASVTLNNSTVVSNGQPAFNVEAGGTLSLNNISLSESGSAGAEQQPLIIVADGATVEMNNGTISGTIGDQPLIQSSGTLHLTGVHFENLTPPVESKAVMTRSIVTRAEGASVVINAGVNEAFIDRITFNGSRLTGFTFIAGSKVTVTNSLFYDNGDMKLVSIAAGQEATLINNTFVTDQDVALVTLEEGGEADIYNNILFTGATDAIVNTNGTLNAEYNALKTSGTLETNNIALASLSDARFAGATDFRLRSDSPLVGKGDATQVGEDDKDVAGNDRLTSGKVNIGAYEAIYTASEEPVEEPPFDPTSVGELVLAEQDEQSVLIDWATIDEAYYFLVNVYQVNKDGRKELVSSDQYNKREILSAGILAFHIEGIDKANTYLIEITALGIFEDALVTRSLTIEATGNTTANAGLSAQVKVYAQSNTLIIESETSVRATVVNLVGQVVYNGTVLGSKQIPVAEGIYIVRLSGKETITRKIHVAQ